MRRATVLCIVGAWLAAAYGGTVQEAVQYQTSFKRSPADDGWNVRQGTWTHDLAAGTYAAGGDGGQLCLYEGLLASGGDSKTLTDYTITAELEHQGAAFAGLAGRVNGNGSLYNLRYNAQAGTERLELYRLGGPTLLLDSAPLALVDLPAKYTLSLKMAGSSLEGKLLEDDVELAVVTAEDGVYSSGPGGLRNSWSGAPMVYHSFTLTTLVYATSRNVSPLDGAGIEETWTELAWLPGAFSLSSDLYMGTDFDDVNDGVAATFLGNTVDISQTVGLPGFPFPDGLVQGTTHYWRVDEVNEADPNSPWKGDVWSFFVYPETAYSPSPVDGMKFVDPNVDLTWKAYKDIASYSVYFGTDYDKVAQGTDTPAIVDAATEFDPGPLALDATYYWRVDVVRLNGETTTGEVWRFTTTREGGGLIGNYHVWTGGAIPTPAESAFTGNLRMTRIDPTINFNWGTDSPDANLVPADYFAVAWTGELEVPFTGSYTFYAAADDGLILWVNDQVVIENWRDGWGHEQRGEIDLVGGEKLSIQMWFYTSVEGATARLLWESDLIVKQVIPAGAFYLPVKASSLEPLNGAVDVIQTPKLRWYAGQKAAQHDVYFGEDANAVADANITTTDIYMGRQDLDAVVFDPDPLEWDKTYYWRIDEINSTDPESPWKGNVWSFTTADFRDVDNFESYTNEVGGSVYEVWVDGIGFTQPEPGNPGNSTGATVGHDIWTEGSPYFEGSIMEIDDVHSGLQAMPVYYDNTADPYYSEAERTWGAPQDWTLDSVDTLILFFLGNADNGAGRLYVAIEDNSGKVAVATNDAALTTTDWTEWKVPLNSFTGVNLSQVKVLYIGVGDRDAPVVGGAGRLTIDDIRLTRP